MYSLPKLYCLMLEWSFIISQWIIPIITALITLGVGIFAYMAAERSAAAARSSNTLAEKMLNIETHRHAQEGRQYSIFIHLEYENIAPDEYQITISIHNKSIQKLTFSQIELCFYWSEASYDPAIVITDIVIDPFGSWHHELESVPNKENYHNAKFVEVKTFFAFHEEMTASLDADGIKELVFENKTERIEFVYSVRDGRKG